VTENNRMPGTFHGTSDFVLILSEAGINQWDQGMNREGLEMVLAAETVLEKDLKDNDSSLRADVHVSIALMMERGIGERRDALERRMSVLKLRRGFAVGGPISREEEIKLYNGYSDLSFSLLEYNDSIQAEELFKICFRKYRQWESEGYHNIHWEWVKYHNAMASIRMLQGRYSEAEARAQDAMSLAGQMGNRSGALKWKFLLGTILLQKGDIDGALRVHQEVRDERKDRAGVMNELTLESFYAVAAIREIQGKWDDAERNLRDSLLHARTAGWCEEAVARSKYHLSIVMRKRNKSEQEAARFYQEAKAVLNKLLPIDKPAWLYGETDEEILFDHLRSYLTRFTGSKLLRRFQTHYNRKTENLSPYRVDELISSSFVLG